ncbi:hypothetical protein [Paenibacillus agricola]|uniref:Uncharacterized protein n=1 Tax=Paenibacillus agricola TaxID=2716264 RepID=A0ABX0JHD9_9BACL|nr:hypothetical protein [Paenibacillus agricola]NHN34983.1 hypothetical protein [Paenibacillus agricola]
MTTRKQWSLAGTWTFATDPKDQGDKGSWYDQEQGLPAGYEVQFPIYGKETEGNWSIIMA